jgi:dTDP-4-amino-4,6-dideoxygalactose transaminase
LSHPIPFNDFLRELPELIQSELKAVERVIRSVWWVLGDEVKHLEASWASSCATSHAVGLANGLDALEVGLRAAGIGPGAEVVTAPLTAYATTLAIERCGATPVFADIDPETDCLDPASVARSVGPQTRAVLVVHLYGRAADLTGLSKLCDFHNILLVEDCAQAHAAIHSGRPVGSFGRFAAWSFYPTMNLGTLGDAGALTTNDSDLADRARRLRNYGQTDRYHHDLQGMNSRLDELQAALLLERLPHLHSWTQRRREIAQRYWSEICHPQLRLLSLPREPDSHAHHLFVLLSAARDAILLALEKQGVKALVHYPLLSTEQAALGSHRIDPQGLSNAQFHARQCFSLPIRPYLSDDEAARVIQACNSLPDALFG